jgi:hypothetical protein
MAKEIPALSLSAYNRLLQDIAAMKRQEWQIANYALLIFGATFWLAPKLPGGPCIGAVIIIASFLYAVFLIRTNQRNIGEARASAAFGGQCHARWLAFQGAQAPLRRCNERPNRARIVQAGRPVYELHAKKRNASVTSSVGSGHAHCADT